MNIARDAAEPAAPSFTPVQLAWRRDGWTPEKQREFIEELADCGIVSEAAARVGMTEQTARRLRRRPDAAAFNEAWDAAIRIGSERLYSIAYERAINGTIRRRYFRGEVVGEERVFDNRLLIYLLGKLPARDSGVASSVEKWDGWMSAVEDGFERPVPAPDKSHRSPVWRGEGGLWLTNFAPPEDFAGREWGGHGEEDYCRELTMEERKSVGAWITRTGDEAAHRRDRYFRRLKGVFDPPLAELSELSDPPIPPRACLGEGDHPQGGGGAGEGDHAQHGGGAGERDYAQASGGAPPRDLAPTQPPTPNPQTPPTKDCDLPPAPVMDASPQDATDPELTLYAHFAARIDAILDELVAAGALPAGLKRDGVTVEPPRDPAHGDLATNAAMVLAKGAATNPRALAGLIAPKLEALDEVKSAEIAGPGFINLRLDPSLWQEELRAILADGDAYGRSTVGAGERINVEYVSANPTGPMHMGHCRGAVVGDALANLLEYAGYAVTREYYVNDAGGQVDTLARSAWLRYREALGQDIEIPEGLYPGDYLKPVGEALAAKYGDRFLGAGESEWLDLFKRETVAAMLELIKADLATLGVHHDLFASEREVQESGAVDRAFALLDQRGLVYRGTLPPPKGKTIEDWEPTELLLFRSTQFGDDQDRPIRKSDGSWTYFAADTAYHMQKLEAADELINVWGADHTGTVKRTQAAVEALAGRSALDVKLVQMVRLLRAGELVKMSKRSGSFVTLAEVVEEVGRDVVRFTMLTRKNDAQMDFDFAKVVEASKDNPVFYVQYAHARIRSLQRKAKEAGLESAGAADLGLLDDEELALVRLAAQFPRIVTAAADVHEPHRIAFYLGDLAAAFHALWNRGNEDPSRRFLLEDQPKITAARLELASAIGQVIRNGLGIMGVAAAEEMH